MTLSGQPGGFGRIEGYMLTRLRIRNFKRFDYVDIELGSPVVLIGPNNSGKTAALQALALWDLGVKRWNERRKGKPAAERRPGVTINRRDLIALPVPDANLLWRDLHVRNVTRADGRQQTQNILVEIVVEGVSEGNAWECGMEFDYANNESLYCRPLRVGDGSKRMPVPDGISDVTVAFLPPMSGLSATETRLDPGAVNVRLGEGRTADVLRNLCYQIVMGPEGPTRWDKLCDQIKGLFGVSLEQPKYIDPRSELEMSYRNPNGVRLDLSTSGRGLQQTLLLLAYMAANPGSVILLDEPDAHLEILRQRQIYRVITESARDQGNQIVAASHSEVILNEAADRDIVVAFVGKPHRIDDRGKKQLEKSLKEIGFEQFFLAEQTGWVLYLEGATDLAILQAFADRLKHPASTALERPFVHYVQNQPRKARAHFHGLAVAHSDLVALALFDRLSPEKIQPTSELHERMWSRRELENYLCQPETLESYAEGLDDEHPLFGQAKREVMKECIEDRVPPVALRDREDRWWIDTKASDDFLDLLFESFFEKLKLPNLMRKTDYHVLVRHVPADQIAPEISEVLDKVLEVAERAKPVTE